MDKNSILDVNLDDAVEPRTVPADTEVEVRIVNVRVADDKNDLPYMMPYFEVVNDDYAKEFNDFIRLPNDEQTPKDKNKAKYRLKQFYETFEVDYSRGVNPSEDLPGKTGWVIPGLRENAMTGEEENYVKRYVVPR